jgi:thioredoxin 1
LANVIWERENNLRIYSLPVEDEIMTDEELENIRKSMYNKILNANKVEKVNNMDGKSVELNDGNFDQMVSKPGLMVVDFWAEWCAPCRFVSPVLDELAKEYAGKMVLGKLNVDLNPQISARFMIRSIPTIMFFKDGKPVDTVIGALPKPMIETKIKKNLNQ